MAVAPAGPHRVRRPFDADGRRMSPGEIVDVTDWRNAYQLVDRGYLVAVSDEPGKTPPTPTPSISQPVTAASSGSSEDVGDEIIDQSCPTCGATGDEPCVSKTGKETVRHRTRP